MSVVHNLYCRSYSIHGPDHGREVSVAAQISPEAHRELEFQAQSSVMARLHRGAGLMDPVAEHNPGDWTVDFAHGLHAGRSEPDLVSNRARVAIAYLSVDVAALHCVGAVEVGYSHGGGERMKASAALMLIDQHPRHRIRLAAHHSPSPRWRICRAIGGISFLSMSPDARVPPYRRLSVWSPDVLQDDFTPAAWVENIARRFDCFKRCFGWSQRCARGSVVGIAEKTMADTEALL